MSEWSDQSDSAFLDVATNTLAVLLMVTMLSLLSSHPLTGLPTSPDALSTPPLAFMEPQRCLFPPWNNYFFVIEDRLVRWDLDAVVSALVAAPAASTGRTPQGTYRLLGEPLTPRDIDTYELVFDGDRQALLADNPPFAAADADTFMGLLSREAAVFNAVPTFVVYASGMDSFAAFYPRLEEAGLRFRWVALRDGQPLIIYRQPAMFTSYTIRSC